MSEKSASINTIMILGLGLKCDCNQHVVLQSFYIGNASCIHSLMSHFSSEKRCRIWKNPGAKSFFVLEIVSTIDGIIDSIIRI